MKVAFELPEFLPLRHTVFKLDLARALRFYLFKNPRLAPKVEQSRENLFLAGEDITDFIGRVKPLNRIDPSSSWNLITPQMLLRRFKIPPVAEGFRTYQLRPFEESFKLAFKLLTGEELSNSALERFSMAIWERKAFDTESDLYMISYVFEIHDKRTNITISIPYTSSSRRESLNGWVLQ